MWSSRVVARSIAKMRLQGGRVRRHEAAQEKANEPDLHRDCWPCGADRPERIADRLATRARRDPMRRSRSAARNAALLRGGLELGRSYNRSSNAKVSAAGIRLDSRKIYRAFKGIICDDVSEFESYMPSHAVGSLWDKDGRGGSRGMSVVDDCCAERSSPTRCGSSFMRSPTTSAISCARWRRRSRSRTGR